MKRNDIVIGVVILAILAGVIYFVRRPKQKVEETTPTVTTEEKLENSFNLQIPDDLDKAELKDTSGGDASGIATRDFENGIFTASVLADLPDLDGGSYKVTLSNGTNEVTLGTMRIAKGGYLLEYTSGTDYSAYNLVKVLSGSQTVLEGSF